ncbi:MAG: bifunctional folylpolyglutamate synthase/dihydrofolate synthase [Gemmatimonadetes bacterium]|nr:bifunctional folylpolyglutamate synthase/dihydrofolate synthase [Gemmatimonadota bacterium]
MAPHVCIPSSAHLWPIGELGNPQKGSAIPPVSELTDRPDLHQIWARTWEVIPSPTLTGRRGVATAVSARGLDWLFARSGGRIKLGLDRVQALLRALGNPHLDMPTLVIGGSNGKGSVATLCASALSAGGAKTGLFTSPHVLDFGERVRIDGHPLPLDRVEHFLARAAPQIEETEATFFEATTALAFCAFRDAGVDLAVLEVGLGGRLDATNVTLPLGAAITSIDLEHTGILGDDRLLIASEKFPIARAGRPLVVGPVEPEVADWFHRSASNDGVELHLIEEDWSWRVRSQSETGLRADLAGPGIELTDLTIELLGRHQAANSALACALLQRADLWPGESAVRQGFADLDLPGRFDIVQTRPVPVVIDVAHNSPGVAASVATWRELWGDEPIAIVFSALRDKDLDAMCAELLPLAGRIYVPELDARRGRPPAPVADLLRRAGADAQQCGSVAEALDGALGLVETGRARGVLCLGSFHVAEGAYRVSRWGASARL